jgi:hypothetical protein
MRNTTMRTSVATLCLLAAAAPACAQYESDYSRHSPDDTGRAQAISRADKPAHAVSLYDAATMSCAEAQRQIQAEGAVVLSFRSTPNRSMPRFGRYVDSDRFCRLLHNTKATSIPTADTNSCAVKECQIWR